MSRYRFSKHSNLGPVHGFTIHTPDNRNLKDLHPQLVVQELNRLNDRIKRLEDAGDALKAAGGWADAVNKWIKAKEAKP